MVNGRSPVCNLVATVSVLVLLNSSVLFMDFLTAISTPPPLVRVEALSCRYNLKSVFGKTSDDITLSLRHVSVPNITSGLVESIKSSISSTLFLILWKLMINVPTLGGGR